MESQIKQLHNESREAAKKLDAERAAKHKYFEAEGKKIWSTINKSLKTKGKYLQYNFEKNVIEELEH